MILTRGSYPSLFSFAFAPNSKCTVISSLQKFRQIAFTYEILILTQAAIELHSLGEILSFSNYHFSIVGSFEKVVCVQLFTRKEKLVLCKISFRHLIFSFK